MMNPTPDRPPNPTPFAASVPGRSGGGFLAATAAAPRGSTRSPVPVFLASLAAAAVLAVALLLGPVTGGSEPTVTGSLLAVIGLAWALMTLGSSRLSAQPQPWMAVPALAFASSGLALIALQPGSGVMDMLGWIWPPALAVLLLWSLARVRAGLRGAGRWIVGVLAVALLAVAVGGAVTTIGSGSAAATAGPGRMVDVGEHSLYIECTGTGSPTVVLEAGLGGSSASWAAIAPDVAASTTVCAYDRAGHERSDEAARPQDGVALATDLEILLDRAGQAGPYVLVGHSSGGPYLRVFADRHPELVAGMVLIDAQPADAFVALPDYPAFYRNARVAYTLAPTFARIGLLGPILGLPANEATPDAARAARDEFAMLPAVLDQAAQLTDIGNRPLVVLSAGAGLQEGWATAQRALADLSTAAVHRVVPSATHSSLITGPDAAASRQAILDVVAAVRTGTAPR